MKLLRFILIPFFALIIISAGTGVSIMDFCASGCKMKVISNTQKKESCCCCQTKEQTSSNQAHAGNCCKSTHYKIDIVKTISSDTQEVTPLVKLIATEQTILHIDAIILQEAELIRICDPPPQPDNSRFYLHLYSTLII